MIIAIMFRILVFFSLILTAAMSSAIAQPTTHSPCDGRFDRMLHGMTVEEDLSHFVSDANAVAICRRALDMDNPAHLTIDAYIDKDSRDPALRARAFERFKQACARGVTAACYYAALFDPHTRDMSRYDQQRQRALEPLAGDNGVPAAAVTLAKHILYVEKDSEPARAQAEKLLRSAQARGDHHAALLRAHLIIDDVPTEKMMNDARPLLLAAAEMGNVPAMLELGGFAEDRGLPEARAWYLKAADSDPRFFKLDRGAASYKLALLYRKGIGGTVDAKQADYWLQHAVELEDIEAEAEFRKR